VSESLKTLADLTGPELYGMLLTCQARGSSPVNAGPDLVAQLTELAAQPHVLGWLLDHYPESRLAEYRKVAQALCAEWWTEEGDESDTTAPLS
jgi:hypothetical protein